jgi:hypothetical protein
MNQFTQIRNYIREAIREINPRIKEHNEAHTSDNVGAFAYDNYYFVRFNPIIPIEQNDLVIYPFSVEIEFGRKAGHEPIDAHDAVMCDALNLSFKLTNKTRYASLFNRVTTNQILPETLASNQSWTKVTISTNIELYFKRS